MARLAFLLLSFLAASAFAQPVPKACAGCHESAKRTVGPTVGDIRAKFKGNASSASDIVARMKEGRGHPKVDGTDAELKAAVEQLIAGR